MVLLGKIKSQTANIGVIGLGYVGLPLSVEKAKAGFVLQGKLIGNNSILAPGSIVLTNVPPNVTVMGNPATILVRHKDHKNKNC